MNFTTADAHVEATSSTGTSPPKPSQGDLRRIRQMVDPEPPCGHHDWYYRRYDTGRLACWSCGL